MSSLKEDEICSLCGRPTQIFWIDRSRKTSYFKCTSCLSVARSNSNFLSDQDEKARYLNHENDIHDKGYQSFVSPITSAVRASFKAKTHKGLDYGCGTGPVISHMLKKHGFKMTLYDPFFFPDESYLDSRYDFIVCCEVMEHFHSPKKEFQKLRRLLNLKGKFYCKTALISNDISVEEFSNWYYKNDPTHVFFYSPKALEYMKEALGFTDLIISEKLITFSL